MALFRKGKKNKYRPEFSGDYHFDYKDPLTLKRFISEGGKITPARISKLSLNQQKKLARAIKKSRSLGMLPLGTRGYDDLGFNMEPISPVPFDI